MLPRTVSGRVVLGFWIIMTTFAGVCGYTLLRMQQLGADLRFIRTAYLDESLTFAFLQTLQSSMVEYLESPQVLGLPYVKKHEEFRLGLLRDSAGRLRELEVPAGHRLAVANQLRRIEFLISEYQKDAPLFEVAYNPQAAPEARRAALDRLLESERHILLRIKAWFNDVKNLAIRTLNSLEQAEEQARWAALGLGVLAALVGLSVAFWAVATLRPLAQLRDGVAKVARGDYRERVSVRGGTEVAELAQEFNAMAAAIDERQQELVRQERLAAVGKMAAIITHEVRNPLSSLGLNAELLQEELASLADGAGGRVEEAAALCRSIQKEVDRLTAITEEYLRFTRLPRPKLEREQVNSIVSGVVEFQREDLESRGVEVAARLSDDLPAIAADEAQLRQALLNLMRNAAEAMSGNGGGALTVSTRRTDGGWVEVRVSDTGPGIAAEHLPRIFEPFFSTKEGGTGLGLALTQQIVAEHGGRIDVESVPGRGTTFVIRLPAS